MASYQRPKGTRIRPTPDWFSLSTASVGGFYVSSNHAKTPEFDLFNDDSLGRCLAVYAIIVGQDGEGIYQCLQVQGHHANGPIQGTPIVTGQGMLPGQLWYDVVNGYIGPPPFPTDTLVSNPYVFLEEAAAANQWALPGPLCVIRPGYSFRVANYMAEAPAMSFGGSMAVTFYYTVVNLPQ